MENFDALVAAYIDEVKAMGRYQPDTPFYRAHKHAADKILELIKYFMEA